MNRIRSGGQFWKPISPEQGQYCRPIHSPAQAITPGADAKLAELRRTIGEKRANPINPGNNKLLVFTAFADTAAYLYENLAGDVCGISALVTGSGTNKTSSARLKTELAIVWMTAPLLLTAPRGDGHCVLVLPGFSADDRSTYWLRRYLNYLGYQGIEWGLGHNFGYRTLGQSEERLRKRVKALAASSGRKISLVGWSLGGVMARHMARDLPNCVRQVVTLGAPFTGDPTATTIRPFYEMLSGEDLDSAQSREAWCANRAAPLVRTTSIYSKSDGVTAWQNCSRSKPSLQKISRWWAATWASRKMPWRSMRSPIAWRSRKASGNPMLRSEHELGPSLRKPDGQPEPPSPGLPALRGRNRGVSSGRRPVLGPANRRAVARRDQRPPQGRRPCHWSGATGPDSWRVRRSARCAPLYASGEQGHRPRLSPT